MAGEGRGLRAEETGLLQDMLEELAAMETYLEREETALLAPLPARPELEDREAEGEAGVLLQEEPAVMVSLEQRDN
jgi:hypothetical protein